VWKGHRGDYEHGAGSTFRQHYMVKNLRNYQFHKQQGTESYSRGRALQKVLGTQKRSPNGFSTHHDRTPR